MKPCIKCGSTNRDSKGKCKPCKAARDAAWRKANSEYLKAKRIADKKANPEKFKAKNKARYLANTEKMKLANAAWYKANRERADALNAEWRKAHPGRMRELRQARLKANLEIVAKKKIYNAIWKKANPEANRIHAQNRRAKKRSSSGSLSNSLAEKLLKLQRGKCAICKIVLTKYQLDHIMPLALNGLNDDANIQLLCPRCNLQKHAIHPIDFMQSKGFLL